MNYNKFIFSFILLCLSTSILGQYNYKYQYYYPEFETGRANDLLFIFNSLNFFKNNEYSGKITEGYTLLGYSLEPFFMYYAGERLSLRAGIHIQKYNGLDRFSQISPIVSAHLALNPSTAIIMGALKGHIHHRLPEPLFEPERQFTRPVEAGIQLLLNKPWFRMDTWIDWEKFVQSNDAFPEKFTFGLSSSTQIFGNPEHLQISIPFDIIATHTGGQISNYPEPVQTIANSTTGLHIEKQWFQAITKGGIFGYHMLYRNLNKKNRLNINHGHAWFTGIFMEGKKENAMLAFFRGKNFISPLGSSLFQSISSKDPSWHETYRNMIIGKLDFHRTFLKQIKFTFRTEAYYDINEEHLDFSNTLQLTFTPRFFIAKAPFY